MQVFPGEQSHLIRHILPRSFSKVLLFLYTRENGIPDTFYEPALPEEVPSQNKWNWLLVQQPFHRCLPAESKGTNLCGYRGT